MNAIEVASHAALASGQLCRGTVHAVSDEGHLVATEHGPPLPCDVLRQGAQATRLDTGDEVLVWLPPQPGARGVILGAVGRTAHDAPAAGARAGGAPPSVPDELLLEAKHSLTLRVGEGSITIREDGKVLIKGRDLVSHAKRMNRIKGGAVSIN